MPQSLGLFDEPGEGVAGLRIEELVRVEGEDPITVLGDLSHSPQVVVPLRRKVVGPRVDEEPNLRARRARAPVAEIGDRAVGRAAIDDGDRVDVRLKLSKVRDEVWQLVVGHQGRMDLHFAHSGQW
jgi:hypothetical protein